LTLDEHSGEQVNPTEEFTAADIFLLAAHTLHVVHTKRRKKKVRKEKSWPF